MATTGTRMAEHRLSFSARTVKNSNARIFFSTLVILTEVAHNCSNVSHTSIRGFLIATSSATLVTQVFSAQCLMETQKPRR